jgi:hypothetical protein
MVMDFRNTRYIVGGKFHSQLPTMWRTFIITLYFIYAGRIFRHLICASRAQVLKLHLLAFNEIQPSNFRAASLFILRIPLGIRYETLNDTCCPTRDKLFVS